MTDKRSRAAELRQRHPHLIYRGYKHSWQAGVFFLEYDFLLAPGLVFCPSWQIPCPQNPAGLSSGMLDNLVFNLGMVELISYWKCACPHQVVVTAGYLAPEQLPFWQKLFRLGLGEFFYINGLNPEDLLPEFVIEHAPTGYPVPELNGRGNLVPVGGGKDSLLTLSLLAGLDNTPFMVNARAAGWDSCRVTGYEPARILEARRTLDPHLLDLNRQNYLNGHTPFSALLAFAGLLTVVLNRKKYLPLSNEASANQGNINGDEVNHQYSKSYEFEDDFIKYYKKWLVRGPEYFSFLRPLSELQITALFARNAQFLPVFQSCNVGQKTDTWCGHCPKCLFVALMLAPFVTPERLQQVFGRDILADTSLAPVLEELVGIAPVKPFECVGTVEEVNQAALMIPEPLPPLIAPYRNRLKPLPDWRTQFNHQHHLPPAFLAVMEQAWQQLNAGN